MTTKMISDKNKMKQRRGISQIIASLLMLALVATVGTVLLIQGNESVETFNSFVNFYRESQTTSAQESILIEHVTFVPTNKTVNFWIRNTGTIEITVDRITMVKTDTQEMIIQNETTAITQTIYPKELEKIQVSTPDSIFLGIVTAAPLKWEKNYLATSTPLNASEYRISITTARGNSFETIAKPFNT